MIAILLAATCIACRYLNMAIGIGADPDLSPCRRDYQRIDPRAHCRIGNENALCIIITPSLPTTAARNAGDAVSYIVQTGMVSRLAILVEFR